MAVKGELKCFRTKSTGWFFGRRNNSPLSVTYNKYIHYIKTAENRNTNEPPPPHLPLPPPNFCFFPQLTSLYPVVEFWPNFSHTF